MISFDEAYRLILDHLPPCRSERVHFQAALNRVLASDLSATTNIPPFNRAVMDGYALRSTDVIHVPADLELIGEIRAGSSTSLTVGAGQAAAITTGAPVPEGADAVQILEQVELLPGGLSISVQQPAEPGQNIVPCGREAAAGALVLEKGRTLGPADLAVLATFGYAEVPVRQRPGVALVVTGDELVEVTETPREGQIRNSNAYSLTAQLQRLGIDPDYLGIARDDEADLHRKMAAGLNYDVMIVSGGASVGPYDLVRSVFTKLGMETLFHRVAVRPGKPTIFARKGDTLVFGLPGNPVSSYVTFEIFVRPALGRMCGLAEPELMRISGRLLATMKQTPGRRSFLPARASWKGDGWEMDPLSWRGSGDIIGFSRADALIIFPGDRDVMMRGEPVEALLLPDFLMRRR